MNPGVAILAAASVCLGALCGCVDRRIEITSEPSGALVYLNDQQIGRTPAQAEFLFHGVYDVRLELDGYEPLRVEAEAHAPLYEHAPIDLAAEIIPLRFNNVQRWHFVLEPSLESTLSREDLEAGLLARAGAMRADLESIPSPTEPDEAADAPLQSDAEAPAPSEPTPSEPAATDVIESQPIVPELLDPEPASSDDG